MPVHPRCRCVLKPQFKSWKDFGFKNVREFEDTARPWAIYEPGNIDEGGKRKLLYAGKGHSCYKGWWFSLTPEEQALTPIGKTKGEWLRDGVVDWEDLIDKKTGKVRLIQDIEKGLLSLGEGVVKPVILSKEQIERFESYKPEIMGVLRSFDVKADIKDISFGRILKSESVFMELKRDGVIVINTDNIEYKKGIIFNPARNLVDAIDIAKKSGKLSFVQEYAFETLNHELTHAKQGVDRTNSSAQEMITQWISRRTYPDLVKKFGGQVNNLNEIKVNGLGYASVVSNFDELIRKAGVKDEEKLAYALINELSKSDRSYRDVVSEVVGVEIGNYGYKLNVAGFKQAVGHATRYDNVLFNNLLSRLNLVKKPAQ